MEGLEETLTLTGLGIRGSLKRTLESTNPWESMIECVRRTACNVKRWQNGRHGAALDRRRHARRAVPTRMGPERPATTAQPRRPEQVEKSMERGERRQKRGTEPAHFSTPCERCAMNMHAECVPRWSSIGPASGQENRFVRSCARRDHLPAPEPDFPGGEQG
jgi:hypothetical protein